MKRLTLIVHGELGETLADTLSALPGVGAFTVGHVENHDAPGTGDTSPAARDRVVGYTPHLRVDLVLDDSQIAAVLSALRAQDRGIAGRGRYWVTDVAAEGRL